MSWRPRTSYIAAGLVVIALTLAIASSLGDSAIVDEVPHIGAAYSYVTKLDLRLNPEHPPLVKDLAGIPLLFIGFNDSVFRQNPWTKDVNGQWNFGRTLIYHSGANPDLVTQLARLPVLLVFFLTGCWCIWRWARERSDETGALIATTLFAFSPTILAHTRLVTTDMAAAVTSLVATYYFVRFLKSSTRRNLLWSVATLGLALLSKFNTVLLIPFFVVTAGIYALDGHLAWRRAARKIFITLCLCALALGGVVWPVYIIQTWNYPAARQIADTQQIMSYNHGILKDLTIDLVKIPGLRALSSWTLGLAMAAQRSAGGSVIYWLGQVVKAGGPWYFPIVYFLKEPLAWWALVTISLVSVIYYRRRSSGEAPVGSWFSRWTDEWIWLLWLAIYWSVSMRSTLNIGIRHLLPVYPFAILLVSGRLSTLISWFKHHHRRGLFWFAGAVSVLIGWYVFESVSVFPYYLTYFNQIAGGPAGGYRYVVDSNVDWGQDLKRLGAWAEQQKIQRLTLDYFGWADPSYYLGSRYIWSNSKQFADAHDFLTHNQSNGWLAVSVQFLQNATGERTFADDSLGSYRWLLNYEPITTIGHSIFVYHIQ